MKITIFTEDKNLFLYLLREIEEKSININKNDITLLSTFELENKKISFKEDNLIVQNINSYSNYDETDVAIFCVRKELTEKYIYDFVENDCIVLDSSSYFINDNSIPTIDFDINKKNIVKYENKNIVKLPSQQSLQLAKILNILNKKNKIKKVFVSTYQATSSISKNAMDELFLHTKKIYENDFLPAINFKKQIPFNVLPQVGDISLNNYYEEEYRLMYETKQIINKDIEINATCVMLPVFNGNCQSLSIEFENDFSISDICNIFEKNEDVITILDRFEEFNYSTPKGISTEDTIFISRIRKSLNSEKILNLWTVADNLTIYNKNILKILNFLLEK